MLVFVEPVVISGSATARFQELPGSAIPIYVLVMGSPHVQRCQRAMTCIGQVHNLEAFGCSVPDMELEGSWKSKSVEAYK